MQLAKTFIVGRVPSQKWIVPPLHIAEYVYFMLKIWQIHKLGLILH